MNVRKACDTVHLTWILFITFSLPHHFQFWNHFSLGELLLTYIFPLWCNSQWKENTTQSKKKRNNQWKQQEWGINLFFNTKSNSTHDVSRLHTHTHTESRIQTKGLESFTRFFSLLVFELCRRTPRICIILSLCILY